MIYGYHTNYLKYTNNIPAQLFSYLLFYMKPHYDQHNYFWYYRPSIIDTLQGLFLAYFIADIGTYSQMKKLSFLPNSQEKISN